MKGLFNYITIHVFLICGLGGSILNGRHSFGLASKMPDVDPSKLKAYDKNSVEKPGYFFRQNELPGSSGRQGGHHHHGGRKHKPLRSLQPNGNSLPQCKGKITAEGLSQQEKDEILKYHNTQRSAILNGDIKELPKAKAMSTLAWNASLENECKRWLHLCPNGNPHAHPPKDWLAFQYGQNMAWGQPTIVEAGRQWFDEYKPYVQAKVDPLIYRETNDEEVRKNNLGMIGHFTAMVNAKSTQIGCYKTSGDPSVVQHKVAYCCNYSPPGNIVQIKGDGSKDNIPAYEADGESSKPAPKEAPLSGSNIPSSGSNHQGASSTSPGVNSTTAAPASAGSTQHGDKSHHHGANSSTPPGASSVSPPSNSSHPTSSSPSPPTNSSLPPSGSSPPPASASEVPNTNVLGTIQNVIESVMPQTGNAKKPQSGVVRKFRVSMPSSKGKSKKTHALKDVKLSDIVQKDKLEKTIIRKLLFTPASLKKKSGDPRYSNHINLDNFVKTEKLKKLAEKKMSLSPPDSISLFDKKKSSRKDSNELTSDEQKKNKLKKKTGILHKDPNVFSNLDKSLESTEYSSTSISDSVSSEDSEQDDLSQGSSEEDDTAKENKFNSKEPASLNDRNDERIVKHKTSSEYESEGKSYEEEERRKAVHETKSPIAPRNSDLHLGLQGLFKLPPFRSSNRKNVVYVFVNQPKDMDTVEVEDLGSVEKGLKASLRNLQKRRIRKDTKNEE